ncbi:MAG: universal stress protein [Gammaproteobacteria bacterium]|nr:universal stress protein [Gammaproteobacteria bacterium]
MLTGRPAETIVDYASEKGAEMIVITTHGHSGLKHVLLGSTTEGVLRRATCPVLSVRSQ